MDKRKTSIAVKEDTWKAWAFFVIEKTGSSRKLSSELEKALEEYMEKHGKPPSRSS